MNLALQVFVDWKNIACRGHSSMSSIRETPKKLAAFLEHKNSSCSDDSCRLCRCLFKVHKRDKFQHISTENLYKLPGKKVVEKRPLDKLLSEDLGLHLFQQSELFFQSLCEVRFIKNSERR